MLARFVADGEHDLGVVPTRAWDVLGVTSLRALNTPFLVSSDAGMRAVIASDLRAGPVRWPAGRRVSRGSTSGRARCDGFSAPRPDGPTCRPGREADPQPESKTVSALLEAMGATAVQGKTSPRTQRGMESSFSMPGVGDLVATGNVVFFPRSRPSWPTRSCERDYDPAQWQILLDAAAATGASCPSPS